MKRTKNPDRGRVWPTLKKHANEVFLWRYTEVVVCRFKFEKCFILQPDENAVLSTADKGLYWLLWVFGHLTIATFRQPIEIFFVHSIEMSQD